MPLLEQDAVFLTSNFDQFDAEKQAAAKDWLRRYKDQQDEFGLPPFPSESLRIQSDEESFANMFGGVDKIDYEPLRGSDDPKRDKMQHANIALLSRANEKQPLEIATRYEFYLNDYSRQKFNKPETDTAGFYSDAAKEMQIQQGQKLVRSRSLDAGFRAAIEGMGSLEKLAAVKSEAAASADNEVDAGAFLEAYGETQKVMSKHSAFIREYSDAIMANMDGGSINLEPLNERLLDMPGTERRMVIAALNLEAQKQGKKVKADKGDGYGKALSQMLQGAFMGASEEGSKFWQQTGEAAGRLARSAAIDQPRIERIIASIPDTGEVMAPGAIKTAKDAQAYVREALMRSDVAEVSAMAAGPGGVGALPVDDNRTTITLDETAQRLIQDAKEREMKRLRVANEIRSIGEAADPIPNVFASTIGTSGAALALMAGTRGLAAPALANAYTNIEFNDLSLKYPQMSTADKTQIAAISGAAQAALDYLGVKALDKLPGIKSLIAQPLTKQLVKRALARGALSYATENIGEAGQDAATPLLLALKQDVPGYDWRKEFDEFLGQRVDVAIGLLPLTLLGIGAASVNEYRGAKKLLSWNDQLGAAGVVETDRVAVIEAAQSGDMGKAQSLLMEARGRRNPEVAAEYQDAMSQRQTDMSRATAELERLGAIPTLRRDGEGWTVTSNGTSTKFATWEEARDVATAAMDDMERAQTELVASLSDSFMASTPGFLKGESVEFNTDAKGESLVDRVNAGAMTLEQAMEAAVAGGVIKGVTMQEARAIAAEVFGGQNASERAMQFRQDVEKIAVLGRNTVQNGQSRSIVNAAGNERSFLTVVEEVVEGRWKGGLERRAFTKEQGVRWVQLAEAATGEKFLEGSTWEEIAASAELAPRALTEAISRIVVADVLGRMKDGKRIGPGTVSSGLNLNDREQSALAAILDAFRKLFRALLETASKLAKARQEGKLGGEYDALFDALTGGSSQLEHDAGAAKEADAIASEAVDTSGYSPETPGPNGETFSMASTSGAAQNAEPSPGGLSEAVDIGASWHKFRDLSDDALVLMKHVTNEDAARTIAREGFNQARKVWKGSEEGFVFLGSTSATNLGIYGAYATQRFGGKTASVIVAVRKGDLLPDDGPDWKAQMKNKSSRSFVAEQFGKDKITKPSAVAAFAELGQLKAKPSNVQVVRILEENGKPVETMSLRPGDFAARMEAKFSLFQAKPELRLAITQVAKEWALRLGAEWIANGDVIRSAKDIGKEARMREALAYEARMNEYLDGLSENARQTLEFEPSALEDDPLVAAMLDFGKLMSFTTAKKSGKVEAKSGDYDGQPWLPPAWFSKGAGIMPDQMAQAMFDAGMLPDAYTGTLWSELEKRIEATRKDKAAHREAVQAYKAAEKYARDASRAEADQWAENAKKQAGSPKAQRDMLKAALRTLDGILAAAPPEVRARVGGYVKLAGLATDEAMLQEIERRIDKLNVELEKWLKKEYLQRIAKLFKRFAPKKDDKGRITSNITAEAAEDIGFAFDFASLDDANQEKEMAAIEKTLEESEDAAEIQDAIGKLAIVQLFHKLEKRESSELEAAAMWIDELGSGAREARKIIDAARAEWVKEAKDAAKADASNGKLSSLPDAENVEADVRSSTFKRFTNDVKGFLNSALFTMGQQLEIVFGQDSRITTEFHRRAVRAANDSTDIKRDIEARRLAFVEKLFGTTSRIKQAGRMGALTVPTASGVMIEAGGKITTIEVPAEIVLRIIEGTADLKALGFTSKEASTLADAWADNEALPVKRQKRVFKIERRSDGKKTELTMSQDEAIQYFLWSNQKASREQMERDGWSKESFQQLNAFLSDDAKALAGFFADEYARLGRLIEPVYRRMFHAPFPRVTNYSPIFRDISSADSIIDINQQGHGSGVSSGFILARNKNARSAMRRTSAISAFMQHAESAAHWIAHVELVRDLRSVLIDKEVQNAIRSNGRTAAANGIKKRVMQLENQGKVGAAGIAELDSWGSRLLQARAFKGLAWRISPVMKQASAYFNPLLADVPAWDYMRGTARLLSGQLDVSAMWNSPDIQRRIEMGFSAESRIAMDKLGYTGSTLLAAMGKGMLPMALMDAGWTTAGAAIAFDYYRRNNVKSGMNEAQAESAALDQLEMMIAESAQPADAVNRSLIEGIQNPWLKSMWMFASESRKTLAIEIMALRRLATGKSKNKALDVQRAVVAHVVMATTTQLMAGILSLLMGDDDDREREWSVEEWAAAIAAGPINGLFLFGDAVDYVGRRLFGLHAFEPSTAIGQAVKTVSSAPGNLDKVINGEPEEQRKAFLRLGEAVGQAASLVGPGNPFTATDVILGNPLKDAEKILTRLTD